MRPLLSVRGLTCGYDHFFLSGIDLDVAGGDFLAVLGPNGSGKTTFLKALLGIIPLRAGSVQVCGRDLDSLSRRERARFIASVPQRPAIPEACTVQDLVLLGRYAHLGLFGLYTKKDRDVVDRVLCATGTESFRNRRLDSLSGGEVQRVLLAMALAQESEILVLDELGAGLDTRSSVTLFSLVRKFCAEGRAALCVMHDYNMAKVFATRLLGIANGKKIFDDASDLAFTEENLSALYSLPMRICEIKGTDKTLACPRCLLA
ncbi:MAG: ABC transporter ATP-binding protein [Desulfovibrionaceae bacterium]|nr:ABC transporter ATP-binding protein [Desulfovibrionaceae bacterium]